MFFFFFVYFLTEGPTFLSEVCAGPYPFDFYLALYIHFPSPASFPPTQGHSPATKCVILLYLVFPVFIFREL